MSADEDIAWLEALAGRGDAAKPADTAEAVALRVLIRAQEFEVYPAVPVTDEAREAQLIERASAQGLLPARAAPGPPVLRAVPRRAWLIGARPALATAAVVMVAVAVWSLRPSEGPTETYRGTENGTVHLQARDPLALKRQLTEELGAAGVRVLGYERLGHVGIDADLTQPIVPQVRQILERHHIPLPADGALAVEIDAPGNR